MSNWSDLEARCNPVFRDTFAENEATYEPLTGSAYSIDVVFGRPGNIEGLDPAFRHAWAILTDFAADPEPGAKLTVDGIEYEVFQVHPEGGGVWLSLKST
jgi:hypothetical protein